MNRGSPESADASLGARGRKMCDRIVRSARDRGVSEDGIRGLVRAYELAMRPRAPRPGGLGTEQHPAYLHPGRTVLILLEDVGERDPLVLTVAALMETRSPELAVSERSVIDLLGMSAESAVDWWRGVPRPNWRVEGDDEALLERAVTAVVPVQRILLAEALDHVRHAHLWPSREHQARAVELTERVFAQIAPRVDATLERRFDWWLRRVAVRLRRPGPA